MKNNTDRSYTRKSSLRDEFSSIIYNMRLNLFKLEDVKRAVQIIKDIGEPDGYGDDEDAHGMEDRLYESAFMAIAAGFGDSKELAEIVLKTGPLKFSRWCA